MLEMTQDDTAPLLETGPIIDDRRDGQVVEPGKALPDKQEDKT